MWRYYPWVSKYRILMTPIYVVIQEKNACLLLTALRWNSLAIFSHQYFQKTTFFSFFILAFLHIRIYALFLARIIFWLSVIFTQTNFSSLKFLTSWMWSKAAAAYADRAQSLWTIFETGRNGKQKVVQRFKCVLLNGIVSPTFLWNVLFECENMKRDKNY
jgi:hypothetical protein